MNTVMRRKGVDRQRISWSRPAAAAVLCVAALGTAASPASAEPAGPAPLGLVPSAAPATATTPDGWTLSLSATNETKLTVPPPPGAPPNELIIGGQFNATLRGPGGARTPVPSGTLEVGYEVLCAPTGLIAATMSNPGLVSTSIISDDFKSADPSVTVTAFHVPVACVGQVLSRSYAILTRTTDGPDSVVAYYGTYVPI